MLNYIKYLVSIGFILFSMTSFSQNYTSEFKNLDQVQAYLSNNYNYLDPLEGIYDVSREIRTKTKVDNDRWVWIIIKKPSSRFFDSYYSHYYHDQKYNDERIDPVIYKSDNDLSLDLSESTYNYSFFSTKTKIILKNERGFAMTFKLDEHSASEFSYGKYHDVTLSYNCIKVFPEEKKVSEGSNSLPPSEWTGTGFALYNRYIVTNYHVVENARKIFIIGINGNHENKYPASVVATDKKNDLALLKINGNISIINIPYSVKTTMSDVGEEVFVLGYPLTATMGDEIKLTTGVISSKSGFQGDISQYQISAPVQPGNSGGPLFDSKGNIIGIVSAKHAGAENVGYAIKSSYLRNLVESVTSSSVLPQTNRVANQNLSGKVKAVKNYIYYITCTR